MISQFPFRFSLFHAAVSNLRKLISEIQSLDVEIHSAEILKSLSNKK